MSFTSPRNVSLIVGIRGISYLGDFLATTALILALQQRGGGGYAVAGILIAAALPVVLLAPVAGRVIDRFPSRLIFGAVGLIQASACVAMSLATQTWQLIALSGLLSMGLAFSTPALSALLPEAAGLERVGRASALQQTVTSIGALIGPTLAGVLIDATGLRVPLLLDAACYLLVAAAGQFISTPRSEKIEKTEIRSGWRLRDDKLLLSIVMMVGALMMTVNTTQVTAVFFVRGTLHASATVYGLVEASAMVGLLIGGWLATTRTADHAALGRRLVLLSLVIVGAVVLVGLTRTVPVLLGLFLISGAANGGMNNAFAVLGAHRVPAAARGRFYATFGAVANGTNLVGSAVGGFLVTHLPPATVISGSGAVGVLAVVLVGGRVWRISGGWHQSLGAPTADVPVV